MLCRGKAQGFFINDQVSLILSLLPAKQKKHELPAYLGLSHALYLLKQTHLHIHLYWHTLTHTYTWCEQHQFEQHRFWCKRICTLGHPMQISLPNKPVSLLSFLPLQQWWDRFMQIFFENLTTFAPLFDRLSLAVAAPLWKRKEKPQNNNMQSACVDLWTLIHADSCERPCPNKFWHTSEF